MDGESSSLASGDGDPLDVFNDFTVSSGGIVPAGTTSILSGFSFSSIPWWVYAGVGGLIIFKFMRR